MHDQRKPTAPVEDQKLRVFEEKANIINFIQSALSGQQSVPLTQVPH